MNYLAHSFISFSEGQIVGNFLEDFVRNSERLDYPLEIQKGIVLHRAIDSFTDLHPEIHEAKKIFQPFVRLYSGAFVDVTMDYFLANDEKCFPRDTLLKHTQKVYEALEKNRIWLPENLKNALPRMKKDNWLLNYKQDWGIEFSLNHVKKKAKYLENDVDVFSIFRNNKDRLREHYEVFFPMLYDFCKNLIANLD